MKGYDYEKYHKERKALRAAVRAKGYMPRNNMPMAELRRAAENPVGMGLRKVNIYPEVIPFDFTGITPRPGAHIRWKSPDPSDRAAVRGVGTFRGIADDGRFLVKYNLQFPSGWASKTIRIHPRFIVDYRED